MYLSIIFLKDVFHLQLE